MRASKSRVVRHVAAAGASAVAVAGVTGIVLALRPVAPDVSLGALYLFAVLPVAVVWGLGYAIPVSVASMLVFNWFFLPPVHTLRLRNSENWTALAVYLVTAIIVSGLAGRARRRAAEAEQGEREAALLAYVSTLLLQSDSVQASLREIASHAGVVIGTDPPRIELGSLRRPEPDEDAKDLAIGDRRVGSIFFERGAPMNSTVADRVIPALASLLAVAVDRERLAREALNTEALRRSDAIKTAILQSVSHDLRSPLTAIRAASEGLENPLVELDEADRATLGETIQAEARRLDRLVENLLDLSRLEAGAAEPRPELWTVDALIAGALEASGSPADRVEVTLFEDLPPVRVDAVQIERVLANLLENALKFSPTSGRVSVTARTERGEVILRVADQGPGIRPAELERIFDAFGRGGVDRDRSGSGLGLAIARGFVLANGGRLWAESMPGRGACFAVAFPANPLAVPAAR